MRVSSLSFTGNFLAEINSLEGQQQTLQNQATTGLKMSLPEDNPAAIEQVLNLQTENSSDTQYQSNITHLQSAAGTASDALNSLQTLVEQANEIATNAGGVTSSTQMSTYATQVGSLIQQALQIGNTRDSQGNYIFGGTDSGSPPFSATTDSSGNITGVTYSGNTSQSKVEIASGLTVSAQTPGENTTGSGPAGVFADSRTGSDIFSHLVSLQQGLTSGNATAISSTVAPALSKDEDSVVSQISANGVLQSTLESAGNSATQQSTSITGQISNDTTADLARTLTLLDQTQTAYQAALQSGTMIMGLSMMQYLH